MRTTITICLLLLACFCHEATHCQPAYEPIKADTVSNFEKFVRIFEVPGVEKSDLYRIAKKWTAINYRSAQHVIQLDDAESGELIIKGISKSVKSYYALGEVFRNDIRHVLTISVKSNKIRVALEFVDIIYPRTSGYSIGNQYVSGSAGREENIKIPLTKGRKKDIALLKKGLVQEANNVFESILEALYSKESSDW